MSTLNLSKNRPVHAWIWILGLAALIYAFLLPRYYVGIYGDDGEYVLAARSLLQGHYVSMNLPDHPAYQHYPPGFPLFLAPFVLLLQPHWFWLKLVSAGVTLVSCFLLWLLSKNWLETPARLALLVLYALNPVTAIFSGFLMSEPCLILFLLLVLTLFQKSLREDRPALVWIL